MKEHFDNATPKRLLVKDGAWTLELEALVPLGDAILRPTTYSIDGPEMILTTLERNPNYQELAMGAHQLIEQARSLGPGPINLAFEARGNGWIPAPPPVAARQKVPEGEEGDDESLRTRMGVRRKDLKLLLARIEALEDRTAQLEETVARLAATPARAEPTIIAKSLREEFQPAAPSIRVPSVSDIEEALKILVGDTISLSEGAPDDLPPLDDTARGYTISRLLDEHSDIVGAVLADVKAVVYQSGALLDSTPAAMKIQVMAEEPAEDALEAWSEIVNNLCGLFNKIEGNPFLRPTSAAPFDPSSEPWLTPGATRADFIDSFNGRLVFLVAK